MIEEYDVESTNFDRQNDMFIPKDATKYENSIAYTIATCNFNKKFNQCNKDCSTCKCNKVILATESLPLHIQTYIACKRDEYLANMLKQHRQQVRNRRADNTMLCFIIALVVAFIVCCIILLFRIHKPNINKAAYLHEYIEEGYWSAGEYYKINPEKIFTVLDATHNNLRDVTNDKVINCQDYTLTFKEQWDKLYNSEDCRVKCMWLKKVGSFEKYPPITHMYVDIRLDNKWLRVEPQGNRQYYRLDAFWERYGLYPIRLSDKEVTEEECLELIKH